MRFGRQVVFNKVADLGFLDFMSKFLSDAQLDRVNTVFLLGFDLGHLASVELDHRARHERAPLVPEVSHANFVPKDARAL